MLLLSSPVLLSYVDVVVCGYVAVVVGIVVVILLLMPLFTFTACVGMIYTCIAIAVIICMAAVDVCCVDGCRYCASFVLVAVMLIVFAVVGITLRGYGCCCCCCRCWYYLYTCVPMLVFMLRLFSCVLVFTVVVTVDRVDVNVVIVVAVADIVDAVDFAVVVYVAICIVIFYVGVVAVCVYAVVVVCHCLFCG